MTSKPITWDELAAMLKPFGRNKGEISRALPQTACSDQSKHIKFERERKIRKVKKGRK